MDFKKYDVRGVIGRELDERVAYRLGRAIVATLNADQIVVGFDARATSPRFATALGNGAMDQGADVLDIGLSGTEEMYWAVTDLDASAGVQVTASHNPIDYNGFKFVKSGSAPLELDTEYKKLKSYAEENAWPDVRAKGKWYDVSKSSRNSYVRKILSLVDLSAIKPLKILINCGNGAAGPTLAVILKALKASGVKLDFEVLFQSPDETFPNGIPNPMLPDNHLLMKNAIKKSGADFGVAFDGDFDRCFLFDDDGKIVPGEYVVGALAKIFLEKENGARIVHDGRLIFNIQAAIAEGNGKPVKSHAGHTFVKRAMRDHNAIYGGEISGHHYFRDFAFCDSGMLPWLIVAQKLSISERPLSKLVEARALEFPSFAEANFSVQSAEFMLEKFIEHYSGKASIEVDDGLSIIFPNGRVNFRKSNTEPLLRMNIEGAGNTADINSIRLEVTKLIKKFKLEPP